MKDNEILVYDVGDDSVGMSSVDILKAELNDEFLKLMIEQRTLWQFRKELQELCDKFYEPEVSYRTYMNHDDWY